MQKAQGGWNAEGKPQGKGDTDEGKDRAREAGVGGGVKKQEGRRRRSRGKETAVERDDQRKKWDFGDGEGTEGKPRQ